MIKFTMAMELTDLHGINLLRDGCIARILCTPHDFTKSAVALPEYFHCATLRKCLADTTLIPLCFNDP